MSKETISKEIVSFYILCNMKVVINDIIGIIGKKEKAYENHNCRR